MKKLGIVLASLLIVALLIGSISCGGEQLVSTPTATPTPSLIVTPTLTPTPTPTPTPILVATPTVTPSPVQHLSGRIAFYSESDDRIKIMDADGSNISGDITQEWANLPDWSPDGKRIACINSNVSGGYGESNICVMNADGSGFVQLTGGGYFYADPDWSPDGKRIAFNRDVPIFGEILVIDVDGSNMKTLYDGCGAANPDWSPDGRYIVFEADPEGVTEDVEQRDQDIFVMNADGTGLKRLTSNPADDHEPAWSPDGRSIAFVSNRAFKDRYDLYVMNADGSGVKRITNVSNVNVRCPTWSPDGKYIAYNDSWLQYGIYAVSSDGLWYSQKLEYGSNPSWTR
jgi:TolB protein